MINQFVKSVIRGFSHPETREALLETAEIIIKTTTILISMVEEKKDCKCNCEYKGRKSNKNNVKNRKR